MMLSDAIPTFALLSREQTNDEYDYIDVEIGGDRAGKVRCLLRYETAIVYNITIYEEFQRKGYGRQTIDMLKSRYRRVIADKVRYNARDFWTKMNFQPSEKDGDWEYVRPQEQ